jgi:hypothetical protein
MYQLTLPHNFFETDQINAGCCIFREQASDPD